jgi:hypothetical protein
VGVCVYIYIYIYIHIYRVIHEVYGAPTYGAYSWGNLVQNLLINLGSVLNSYGVIVDFLNASL